MKDGKLYSSGGIVMPGKGEKLDWKPEETVIDALGNESKAKAPKKKLSNKEKKKAAKVSVHGIINLLVILHVPFKFV